MPGAGGDKASGSTEDSAGSGKPAWKLSGLVPTGGGVARSASEEKTPWDPSADGAFGHGRS
jgi:hypothetical protein